MAYTRVNWTPNQLVTAEDLNKMDEGIDTAPHRNTSGTSYGCVFPNVTIPTVTNSDSLPDSQNNTWTSSSDRAQIGFYDSNSHQFSALSTSFTNKTIQIDIRADIPSASGSSSPTGLLGVKIDRSKDKDNAVSYVISNPTAFRKALTKSDLTASQMYALSDAQYAGGLFSYQDSDGRILGNFGSVTVPTNSSLSVTHKTCTQTVIRAFAKHTYNSSTQVYSPGVTATFGVLAAEDGTVAIVSNEATLRALVTSLNEILATNSKLTLA